MRFQLHEYESVDSTNERAFAALAEGRARHGDVHVAHAQTAGRGRRGARWHSAPGEGLYMSVVLLPQALAAHPAVWTMAAGVAVWAALRELGLAGTRLKWPNDVVVDRPPAAPSKLAGILVETRGLDAARPHYVIGIGVNRAQRSFPPELVRERAVASLWQMGVEVDAVPLRQAILARLADVLELANQPAERLTEAFVDATGLRGRTVEVEMPSATFRGRWATLSLDRGIELVDECGALRQLPLEHVRQVREMEPGRDG